MLGRRASRAGSPAGALGDSESRGSQHAARRPSLAGWRAGRSVSAPPWRREEAQARASYAPFESSRRLRAAAGVCTVAGGLVGVLHVGASGRCASVEAVCGWSVGHIVTTGM